MRKLNEIIPEIMEKTSVFNEGGDNYIPIIDMSPFEDCKALATRGIKHCLHNSVSEKTIIELIDALKNVNDIPDKLNESVQSEFNGGLRDIYVAYRGFSIVNNKTIRRLSDLLKGKKVLEIMSGCGFLAQALRNQGIDIIATDNYSWEKSFDIFYDVEKIDALDAIEKYNDCDYIVMSWAYMDNTAYRCLQKMREVNPNAIMIEIGEGYGGCTADDKFYDNVKCLDDNDINKGFQTFAGIHDYISIIK